MSEWDEAFPQNHLLSAMPYVAFEAIRPSLDPTILPIGSVLSAANTPILYVHFLSDGIATSDGPTSMTLIGREGMSAETVINPSPEAAYDAVMQVSGSSLRIPVIELLRTMRDCEPLRTFLRRYVDAQTAERAQAASLGVRHTPLERTARWLLMCHDRVDGDLLPLNHTFLHRLVGGPAAGVSESLQRLELNQSIHKTSGWIEIRHRERLVRVAGTAYRPLTQTQASLSGRLG